MAKTNPESLMNESGKFGKEKKIDRMDGKKTETVRRQRVVNLEKRKR